MEEFKKTRLDVMLDMETCGIRQDACILSIAMVPFTLQRGYEAIESYFYKKIDLTSCYMAGMSLDEDTQKWWMKQDASAQLEQMDGEKHSVGSVADEAWKFLDTLSQTHEVYIWSRGLDFDIPKLEYLFERFLEKGTPYKYYNKRDARTYVRELGVNELELKPVGIKHSALDDCFNQIEQVKLAYSRFTKN